MEAVNKAVETVTHAIWGGNSSSDEQHRQPQLPTPQNAQQQTKDSCEGVPTQQHNYKPTEHMIRDDADTGITGERLPTAGPGHSIYLNKPIVTTTSETSTLTDTEPGFANLSLKSVNAEGDILGERGPYLKDTGVIGHRRVDSGHDADFEPEEKGTTGAQQRYGVERGYEDGIKRTTSMNEMQVDPSIRTTEGYPRPKFVGTEQGEDRIRRADGRERVKFNDPAGATGSLRPSEDKENRNREKVESRGIKYADLRGSMPRGTRVGTVQEGGRYAEEQQPFHQQQQQQRSQQQQREKDLEEAQTAQTGGLAATAGSGRFPASKSHSAQSSQQQTRSVLEDSSQTNPAPPQRDIQPSHDPQDASLTGTKYALETPIHTVTSDTTSRTTDQGHEQPAQTRPPQPTQHQPITEQSTLGPQREGISSTNEPTSQGGITNPAATNTITPMGPGQTQAIGGRMEPSVGADPKHVQQPTQKQQGGDRPLEEPSGDLKSGKEQRQGENKEEAGHYVKSTGVAAEGGDFDAAKPGAGKEADRLLEQAGLHRTEQGAASTKSDRGHEHGLHLPHHHHLHHHHDAETAVGTTGTGVGKSGGPAGNARMGATAESEGTKSDDGHEHGLHLPHRHHHHHHPHHHHLHLHLHHDTETAVGTRGSGVGKNGGPAGNAAAETEGKRGGFGEKIKKIHLPHME